VGIAVEARHIGILDVLALKQIQSRGQIGFFPGMKKDAHEEGLTIGCSVGCTCGIFWIPQLCSWLLHKYYFLF
jgi:hypothetical protein